MNYSDFILYLLDDGAYLGVFCQKYEAVLVDVIPNTEKFPPKGLLYEFDNQLGRFSIQGIKNSLKENSLDEKVLENGEYKRR